MQRINEKRNLPIMQKKCDQLIGIYLTLANIFQGRNYELILYSYMLQTLIHPCRHSVIHNVLLTITRTGKYRIIVHSQVKVHVKFVIMNKHLWYNIFSCTGYLFYILSSTIWCWVCNIIISKFYPTLGFRTLANSNYLHIPNRRLDIQGVKKKVTVFQIATAHSLLN